MEKVRIALYTPLPGFANDLCDVLKLFFEVEAFAVNPEGADGEPLRMNTRSAAAWRGA